MPPLELFQYYGVDHAAMILCFVAMWLIGNKNPSGFVVFMLGNACWTVFGVMTASVGVIIGNVGFILLNARGLWQWAQEKKLAAATE
ncbi:nicotinamide mononucleotide transporter [Stratiformator vulcanicus]|uniref:PnuC protein n=1 Tax=Stratiformator vulcanicus TaxID=2527980 RepID=A0A517QXB4_9PLAN|nr:nicotinamide mononucleotide transporter [Stratiformator vulcanicus]QDT36295.1 hypothetical protein Pan189_06510 [Stratiformator vulcanicus]